MYTLLLLSAAAVVAVTWGLVVFRLAGGGTTDAYGMCAPARYEPLTARPAETPHRIVAELAPPAGWRDVPLHVAIVPAPAVVTHDDDDPDDEPIGVPESVLIALLTGEQEPAPLAVPIWPKLKPVEQPAVVEPDPVPVVVNRTAARFSALEVTQQ